MKQLSIIILTLFMSTTLFGQSLPGIPNGVWSGTLSVKTNSFLVSGLGERLALIWNPAINEALEDASIYNNWYNMDFPLMIHVPSYQMYDANDNILKMGSSQWWKNWFWNWNYNFDIAPCYEITWSPLAIPQINLIAGIGYEFKQLYFQDEFLEGRHMTHALIPSAALRFYLFNPSKNKNFNISIEGGATYVYHFKYTNPQNYVLEALNDGIRGRFRLMMGNPNALMLSIRYEYDFYNFFNQEYSHDGGLAFPFAGIKNTFGGLNIQFLFSTELLEML